MASTKTQTIPATKGKSLSSSFSSRVSARVITWSKAKLAYMSEAVTKLTKEAHHDKEPSQDVHKKGPHHEAESSEKGLGHEIESGEKLHGKGDASSVGSLSVQQFQDMIANTIRVQYGALSQDTLIYSKPYTRRIDNLRMPRG
ncbi:unnamed protein product [Prunus armeniaca]